MRRTSTDLLLMPAPFANTSSQPPLTGHLLVIRAQPPARFTGTRSGGSMDILVLYYGSSDEIAEYIQGFLVLGYFFLVVYLIWSIALCALMCCGRRRVGFLSGRPFSQRRLRQTMPFDGTDRMEDDNANPHDNHYDNQRAQQHTYDNSKGVRQGGGCCSPAEPLCSVPNIIRIAFIVLAFFVLLLSILFATKGLQAMQEGTVDVFHQNTLQVQSLTLQGRNLLNQGSNAITSSADLIRTAFNRESQASNFCPADPSLRNSQAARDAFEQILDAKSTIDCK